MSLLIFAFVAQLVSETNRPWQGLLWLPVAILSLIVLVVWLMWLIFLRKRHSMDRPWVYLLVVLGGLWIFYGLTWIPLPTCFFVVLASFLFLWTILDLSALTLKIHKPCEEGKVGKCITISVKRLERFVSWPLGFIVLFAGFFLTSARLLSAGAKGWWINVLLILGYIVIITYEVTIFQWTSRGRHD